jgi:hypothetical protein
MKINIPFRNKTKFRSEPLIIYCLYTLTIILQSCNLLEEFKFPVQSFTSKYISSYRLKRIAVLPVIPDTKDSAGAYYATNYFTDLLTDCYPAIQVAEVDDVRKSEISFIPDMVKDIKQFRIMDYKNFGNTDIGEALKKWNCDAIFVGTIDSVKYESGWVNTFDYKGLLKGRKTNCYFRYFLISLKDGRVLWKVSVRGTEVFYGKRKSDDGSFCPPLSVAMSNGIELISDELPGEIFKH